MIAAASEAFQLQPSANEGYAVSSTRLRASPARSCRTGPQAWSTLVRRAFLGVEAQSPFFGVSGAEIMEVVPGGPAANAGLVPGDIVTAINGQAITSPEVLGHLMLGESPRSSVPVNCLDPYGGQSTVTVQLASGPAQ